LENGEILKNTDHHTNEIFKHHDTLGPGTQSFELNSTTESTDRGGTRLKVEIFQQRALSIEPSPERSLIEGKIIHVSTPKSG
jgi:hypothetical protein